MISEKVFNIRKIIFIIMLGMIIPFDFSIKFLHKEYYDIPMYITNVLLFIYGVFTVVCSIGILAYYKKYKSLPHLSKGFKKAVLVIIIINIFYFGLFRRPIGLSRNYFMIDNIVIEESINHQYTNETVVEDKWKLFNSLKYAMHKMDYDYGFTEGLSGDYRITINYKDNSGFEYFYYNTELGATSYAVTNYKVLNYYNDNILECIVNEIEE